MAKTGPMRDALKRKLDSKKPLPEEDMMLPIEEGPAIAIKVAKDLGSPESEPEDESGPDEGTYTDALSELSSCVEHLDSARKEEAQQLIDKLGEIFRAKTEKPEDKSVEVNAPDGETVPGGTGNSNLSNY